MKNLVKVLTVIIILLYSIKTYSQDDVSKWTSSVYMDLISNNKNLYTYYDSDNKIRETSIREKGSLELVYNIDYNFSKKFAIITLIGYNHFINPKSSSLKIGAGVKFLYVDSKYHYLTLQYGYHIPFDKNQFREGHQIKIGQYFDITEFLNNRLILGLYYNYDFLYMDGSNPLFSISNKPSSLKYNSYGISLGIKF